MKTALTYLFVGLHAVGIPLYLTLAAPGWRDPAEGSMVNTSGEPLFWAVCLPVLMLLILTDVVWGATLIMSSRLRNGKILLGCIAALVFAIAVDFAHH